MTYVVPKDRQYIILHFSSGTTRHGSIFLEYSAPGLSLLQKVQAFLEATSQFFPLSTDGAGRTEFVQKKSVLIVEMDYPDDGSDITITLMHSTAVVLTFRSGISLSGELLAEVPEQKSRLSDCLNLPTAFLMVKVQGKLFFVNKSELQQVVHAD